MAAKQIRYGHCPAEEVELYFPDRPPAFHSVVARLVPGRRSCALRWLGGLPPGRFELTEEAAIVSSYPLLDELALRVKPEDVDQVPNDALAVRRHCTHR